MPTIILTLVSMEQLSNTRAEKLFVEPLFSNIRTSRLL